MTTLKGLIDVWYKEAELKEFELKETLEKKFHTKLNCTDRYDLFDYINDDKTIYIELKVRNNKSDKYKSTMIGLNKIKAAEILKT
jgi:hypothetical protein